MFYVMALQLTKNNEMYSLCRIVCVFNSSRPWCPDTLSDNVKLLHKLLAPSEPNYNKVPLSPFFPLFATSLWLASPVHWSSSIQPKTHTPSSSSSSAPSILAGISTEFLLQPYWFCLQPLHTTTRVIFFFFLTLETRLLYSNLLSQG